jgi:DeoR/GlpR family transcriptional regulator of sugar metabolism
MNPAARERFILERVEATGACTYQSLAEAIGVAEMTIRRDVERMSKRGSVLKILGGVQTAGAPKQFYESALQDRVRRNAREKRAIALQTLTLIQPQQTIFLDGGTTSLAFAKVLAEQDAPLSVVTNSTYVCLELAKCKNLSVLSLGGKFDPGSGCLVGPTSEELSARFFVDLAFFSTMGVIPGEGTFESNIATLRIKQLIGGQAGKIVLLVDHSKFGARALCKVLDIHQIQVVVTDKGTPATTLRELGKQGLEVMVASEPARAMEVGSRVT